MPIRNTIRRIVGKRRIRLRHLALKLERRGGGIHRAAELDQDAVADDLDDTPAMGADDGLEDRCPPHLPRRKVPASSASMRRL